MADIFVSYARQDKERVTPLVAALKAQGWSVWWDPAIVPGEEFDSLIRAEIRASSAVIVVWTPASVASRWVRGEARLGAERGVLVPVRFERAELPIDAMAIHTTDLDNWKEDAKSGAFQELLGALSRHLKDVPRAASEAERRTSICVLPFANMSDDAQQEYFADGISEDIITDLSKVSALAVISRNSAFTFKGRHVDLPQVAKQLNVSHVLEGSVRRSGNRVRITAQLIDGTTNNHVWAERYDRDLNDIFALQDEISEAIVGALKIKLFPEEKKAIEDRGTNNVEAYDLFLRARAVGAQMTAAGLKRGIELIRQAIALDPGFLPAHGMLIGMLMDYVIVAPHERANVLPQVEEARRRIIEFSPDDEWPRMMEAMLHGDFDAAEQIVTRLEKSGRSHSPMVDAARARFWLDENVARFDGSVSIYREHVRQDPLSLVVSAIFQMLLDNAGRWQEAQAEYERSRDLAGDHSVLDLMAFIRMWDRLGQDEIAAHYKRFLDTRAGALDIPVFDELAPVVFDVAAARAIIARAIEDPAYQDGTRLAWLALLAGLYSDPKSAFTALKRAHIDMQFRPTRLIWHPRLAAARQEPGFKDVVRTLGVYDYWHKTGKWSEFARPLGDDDFEIIK